MISFFEDICKLFFQSFRVRLKMCQHVFFKDFFLSSFEGAVVTPQSFSDPLVIRCVIVNVRWSFTVWNIRMALRQALLRYTLAGGHVGNSGGENRLLCFFLCFVEYLIGTECTTEALQRSVRSCDRVLDGSSKCASSNGLFGKYCKSDVDSWAPLLRRIQHTT